MFSKESDEYETPRWLFDRFDSIFHFDLDPAASDLSHMCEKYYKKGEYVLMPSWAGSTVWLNPPYSDCANWVEKAALEHTHNGVEAAILVPARTETRYWHKYIWPKAKYILFLNKRLKFLNRVREATSSAPFPSVVALYTKRDIDYHAFRDLGAWVQLRFEAPALSAEAILRNYGL